MLNFEKQEIKSQSVSASQLKQMRDMAGSYDALLSKKAIKYRELNLKDEALSEERMQELILQEYTLLRRPVIIIDHHVFIGHQEETINAVAQLLKRKN